MKNHASHEVLGCPHCHAEPEVKVFAPDDVRIACRRHPDVPVSLHGERVAAAIADWNDSADWARIGTNQIDAAALSTRPAFQISI